MKNHFPHKWKYTPAKVFAWAIPHFALLASAIAGMEFHKERYANMLRFAVWILVAAYAFVIYSEQPKEFAKDIGPRVPPGFALTFDMMLAFYIASHGWFVTASAYAAVAAVSFIVFKAAEMPDYPKPNKAQEQEKAIENAVMAERARCNMIALELRERQAALNPEHSPCPFRGDMIEAHYRISNGLR